MKKIIYYIAMLVICLLPFPCSLEEETRTEIEKKNYMNNVEEARGVLLGVYRTNTLDTTYGYYLSILFNLGTDILQVENSDNENFRIIPTNSFLITQSEVQQTWAALYTGIYRVNDFLERISNKIGSYTITNKKPATLYIAEVRALRGMLYFELVRRFGNVILIISTQMSNQSPATCVQSAPEKVYEYIEDDLLYICDILPYATDDQYRRSNDYRFSKGVALGLLIKVYATWVGYPVKDESKQEAAAKTTRISVESGKHGLLKDYEQLWKNTCNGAWGPTEDLIEISFYSSTVPGNSNPVGRTGKWNGVKTIAIAGVRGSCAANVKVARTFVLDWREDVSDIRRGLPTANYQYTDTKKSLQVVGTSDTDESAAEKDTDPTKAQRNRQNYTSAKWDIQKYVTTNSSINNNKSNVN